MAATISAKELAAMEKARQNVKKETYKAILEQFSRKIKVSYELGRKEALLTIPPFVIGYPKYDLAKALVYMCRQLQKLGYTVELTGPISLKVTWATQQPQADQEDLMDDGSLDILPGLVNLQKTAQKLRITKKK